MLDDGRQRTIVPQERVRFEREEARGNAVGGFGQFCSERGGGKERFDTRGKRDVVRVSSDAFFVEC